MHKWLQWDCTIKDSPFSLHPAKECLKLCFMSLLWSRKESEKEKNKSLVILLWNNHEVHVHPPALSSLLSSALWGLSGYLISEGSYSAPTPILQSSLWLPVKKARFIIKHGEISKSLTQNPSVCFPFLPQVSQSETEQFCSRKENPVLVFPESQMSIYL